MTPLVVRKVLGLALVQDQGRVGFASQGVPRGGALVAALARRANDAVGNDPTAACVEIIGGLRVIAERECTVATERGDARVLRAGEELLVEPDGRFRARYLALAGGVAAPERLGSRSTLTVAGIGRPLRAGDRIASAGALGAPRAPRVFVSDGPIGVVLGPDEPDAALALVATEWRVGSASDRTGTRLDGGAIPRTGPRAVASTPIVCGAVQLPSGGGPIVIGPDGPTTGGYPVVAVIVRADVDAFHARPVGALVRFEVRG